MVIYDVLANGVGLTQMGSLFFNNGMEGEVMSSRLVGACLTHQQTKELLWVYDVLCHCLGIVRVGSETQSHILKNCYGN